MVATVNSKHKQTPEQETKEWAGGSVNFIPAYEKVTKPGAEGTREWFTFLVRQPTPAKSRSSSTSCGVSSPVNGITYLDRSQWTSSHQRFSLDLQVTLFT